MARNAFFYLSNLLTRIVVSFRGYITGDTQDAADRTEFLEPLQADRGAEIDRNQTTVQNENGELPPDRSNSGTSIYLSSNAGTVIIGNNTVFRLSNIETAGCETEKNDEVALSLRNSKPTLKEEPPITNIDEKNTRRRSRKPKTASLKPPAVVRRFKEIQKTLSKYRGDGKWSEHAKAVKCFENEYKRDKDNLDIILLLMYEKAVAYYEKNEIGMARTLAHKIKGELDTARKMVTKVSREISVQYKETNWQQIDDNKKIIYCKCLFLVSRIYCVKGRFEKARKAVDFANQILSRHLNNVELKANLYLAYAQVYQVCFNRVHCTSKGVTQVFSYLDKSEAISRNLKKPDPEKWEEIRREILLLRSLAIVQFYLHDGNKLEFVNVLDGSLEELEHHLWDGILLKQKVCCLKMSARSSELIR